MTRERYIAVGLIVPFRAPTPLTADELDSLGFHSAAAARRARK